MSQVVCFGGGTNSTAMLIGMHERGERPDAILFADTGGEKPHTYEHVTIMQKWCDANGFPPLLTVKVWQPSKMGSLEQFCLTRGVLPSIAYGFRNCSVQYKVEPVTKWLKEHDMVDAVRLVGIDAGENHRARYGGDNKFNTRYPLIEWGWDREECIAAIARAGIPQPGKSACFFCPSSTKTEILDLAKQYPDLMERALAMEANAKLLSVKGLGRRFSWRDLIAWDKAQIDLFVDAAQEMPCECYEG